MPQALRAAHFVIAIRKFPSCARVLILVCERGHILAPTTTAGAALFGFFFSFHSFPSPCSIRVQYVSTGSSQTGIGAEGAVAGM